MTVPLDTVLWTGGIVTLAYTVFGLTGFGASITAVPLLAHFFPLRFAVPMMLVFDLCAGLLVGWKSRGEIDKAELQRLVPFMLVGVALGTTVLVNAPEASLLLALGCFVLAYAVWSILFRPGGTPIASIWSVPLGTLGGVFSALFGTGGPLYAIYLTRRLPEKSVLRATISSVITLSGVSRLCIFIGTGLYAQQGLLPLAVVLLPCALLGVSIGSRLHRVLPTLRAVQAIWLLLIVGGLSLVRRGLSAM
ncbi:MAG: sulfite exporter TauE/SafE family protein [Pseudomonadota bacterium]